MEEKFRIHDVTAGMNDLVSVSRTKRKVAKRFIWYPGKGVLL